MLVHWAAPPKPEVFKDFPEFKIVTTRIGKPEAWVCDPLVQIDNVPSSVKYLITPSTGTNHINVKGVKVLSLLDDRAGLDEIRASSEFTFMMILMGLRKGVPRQWRKYKRDDDLMRGFELYGKKVGIVGYGRIGKNVARWVQAFGATWDYFDPALRNHGQKDLKRLFGNSDIVVISCSLNNKTRGMITSRHLGKMRKGALLVNTARAEIIREKDLLEFAEKKEQIYAADVLHGEVTGDHVNSKLLHLPNCIITPHIAGTTYESQEKAARIALGLLRKELECL
jgi:D-3-phosphoglycerate dehydrogenase